MCSDRIFYYIFHYVCSYRELYRGNILFTTAELNDFKSLRFKLLCKSYFILIDVFTYHQVQVGTDLGLMFLIFWSKFMKSKPTVHTRQ